MKNNDSPLQSERYINCKGLSTQAIGNNLLPFLATICCRFRQQFVAVLATICCRFRQQFVAVFGNNLMPVWTGLKSRIFEYDSVNITDSYIMLQ